MLLKPTTDLHDPSARHCWECVHGNDGKPSKLKVITCGIDGAPTMRLIPGHCQHFTENERGKKARMRNAERFKRDLSRSICR